MLGAAQRQPVASPMEEERKRFLTDTLDLFAGRQTGHMNAYAFNEPDPAITDDPVRGGEFWTRMIAVAGDYYVIREECAIVQRYAGEIGSDLPVRLTSIDCGPGEEKAVIGKTLPFNRSLRNPLEFIAVDVNGVFARAAADIIQTRENIPSRPVQGDFLAENLNLCPSNPAVMSLFGGLLCNSGQEKGKPGLTKLSETFNRLSQNMKPGDYLVITQDVNNDPETLMKAYSHEFMGRYILSTLHKIKRDLPTRHFDPQAFEFIPRWSPDEHLLTLNARATDIMAFEIGNQPFTVAEGKEIPLVNVYKFPLDAFINAARNANFSSQALYKSLNGRIALHVLRYDGKGPDVSPDQWEYGYGT